MAQAPLISEVSRNSRHTNWDNRTSGRVIAKQMVLIAHPTYALHSISRLKWTATQEKTLCREYPFVDLDTESPDQFVQRTYLQFLWLPEVRTL